MGEWTSDTTDRAWLIALLAILVVLVAVIMVMSAKAAVAATDGADECEENCHKWATWSTVLCGISLFLMIVGGGVLVARAHNRQPFDERAAMQAARLAAGTRGAGSGFVGGYMDPYGAKAAAEADARAQRDAAVADLAAAEMMRRTRVADQAARATARATEQAAYDRKRAAYGRPGFVGDVGRRLAGVEAPNPSPSAPLGSTAGPFDTSGRYI